VKPNTSIIVDQLPCTRRELKALKVAVEVVTREELDAEAVAVTPSSPVEVAPNVDYSYGVVWRGASPKRMNDYGTFERDVAVFDLADDIKQKLLTKSGFAKVAK